MFRFKVVGAALVNDVRGRPRVRLTLVARPSPGFGSTEENAAPPEGAITMTVTLEAAAKFSLGDEFTAVFREREVE